MPSRERSSSLEGVERLPKIPANNNVARDENESTAIASTAVEEKANNSPSENAEAPGENSLTGASSSVKSSESSSRRRRSTSRSRKARSSNTSSAHSSENQGDNKYLACSSSSDDEDSVGSDEEFSYSIVSPVPPKDLSELSVVARAQPGVLEAYEASKAKAASASKTKQEHSPSPEKKQKEESNMATTAEVHRVRPDLSPEKIQELMSVLHNMRSQQLEGQNGPEAAFVDGSNPPVPMPVPDEQEMKEFLDYVGNGVINEDYLRQLQEQQAQDLMDQDEELSEEQKRSKTANHYFYRHHYLSIIQEEEEHSENPTPSSSRASSRPGSIYGMTPGMARAFREFQNSGSNGGAVGTGSSEENSPEKRSPVIHRNSARVKTDSMISEVSVDSLASVNSILSQESSSRSRLSGNSTGSTLTEGEIQELQKALMNREASQSLTHLLENVPPPPTSQPPTLAPEVQKSVVAAAKEASKPVHQKGPAPKPPPTSKIQLESKLSEIQKQVQQQQQSKQGKQVSSSKVNTSNSSVQNSATGQQKYSSMKEILKSVVSSQKNVLHKKVETLENGQQVTSGTNNNNSNVTSGSSKSSNKLGKFFKTPFQSLTKSNSLSKSSQSLSLSKDSLVQQPEVKPLPSNKLTSGLTAKSRSKSLSSENRKPLNNPSASASASASGSQENQPAERPSSAADDRKGRQTGNKSRVVLDQGSTGSSNNRGTRWLGKNPFEQDTKSPNEVELNPFVAETSVAIDNDQQSGNPKTFSGLPSATQMAGPVTPAPERGAEKAGSAVGGNRKCGFSKPEIDNSDTNRVKSTYENVIEKTSVSTNEAKTGKQNGSNNITDLIKECEEYVKTEAFTKDLSKQILKIFMQERSTSLGNFQKSGNLELPENHYDVPRKLSTGSLPVNYENRKSVYENSPEKQLKQHEESPDSSGYDSDKNKEPEILESFPVKSSVLSGSSQPEIRAFPVFNGIESRAVYGSNFRENSRAMVPQLDNRDSLSKSSSLGNMLSGSEDDEIVSNASTIKNANVDNMSYDTVLR